jgi:hypothetical protein
MRVAGAPTMAAWRATDAGGASAIIRVVGYAGDAMQPLRVLNGLQGFYCF